MEPVAAVLAATAGETAVTTSTTVEANATAASLAESAEVASEASESLLGEKGLLEQLDMVQHSSLESVAARNEGAIQEVVPQCVKNKIDGGAREDAVAGELEKAFPEADGFRIEKECSLRDEARNIVRDPISGESRRLDFAIIKDGEVIKSLEVTSQTADKTFQIAKEHRIREAGGNFIEDRTTGNLVPFAENVKTEIVRRA